ncbi:MAG TPA: type II secretion system F family protein, partial [Patescibacteria group bacterium]|nr:type II secretion system F family protein [Patescibacteria group bacterium]
FLIINIRQTKNATWRQFFEYSTVSKLERINFTRHLHSFLGAGIALGQSLKIAAEQTVNKKLKTILSDLHNQIMSGRSLFNALERHTKYFSRYFIKLIRVGEESGKLDEILGHLLEQQEKEYELLINVRSALIYPIILITATLGMVIFMITFVIPTITAVLIEYGGALPLPTKIIVFVSNTFINYGVFIVLGLLLLISALRLALRQEKGRLAWENFLFHLPLIKKVIVEYNLAFLTRAIATPLVSGLSIDKSLELAADTTKNLHYQKSLLSAVALVRRGIPLSEILKGYPTLYPPSVIGLVEMGEKTGRTDQMFNRLSQTYEKSITNIFKNLSSIIEPFMLVTIGLVVGLIALAVFTPLWRLADTIK